MKNFIRVWVLSVIFAAIVFFSAYWLIDFQELTARFWYAVGPIGIAIIALALCHSALAQKSERQATPWLVLQLIVPWGYLLFTIIMSFTYASDLSNPAIAVIQLIGAFISLVLISCGKMAVEKNIVDNAAAQAQFNPREDFKLKLADIADQIVLKFSTDEELLAVLAKSRDAIRFAADSIPGCEALDQQVYEKLDELEALIPTGNREVIFERLSGLNIFMKSRERQIKANRK